VLALPHYAWDRVDCWFDEADGSSAADLSSGSRGQGSVDGAGRADTLSTGGGHGSATGDSDLFFGEVWEERSLPQAKPAAAFAVAARGGADVVPFYVAGGSGSEVDIAGWLPVTRTVACSRLDAATIHSCVAKFGRLLVFQGFTSEASESTSSADRESEGAVGEGSAPSVPAAQIAHVADTIATLQALVQAKAALSTCLFVVRYSRELAAVVGAVRCAVNEHPELNIRLCLVDTAANIPISLDALLKSAALQASTELRLSLRRSSAPAEDGTAAALQLEVRQVVPLPQFASSARGGGSSSNSSNSIVVGGEGTTYVVTGGMGGLGMLVVEWLVHSIGASRVVVLSRRRVTAVPPSFVREGCAVVIMQCDIESPQAFTAGLAAHAVPVAAITGVFHCAGAVHDSLVQNAPVDTTILRTQMGAKVCVHAHTPSSHTALTASQRIALLLPCVWDVGMLPSLFANV
jgi:hypothetical protein